MRWQLKVSLFFGVALFACVAQAAVTPGQIDEFNLQPTSTYGWSNGGAGFGIENIATGGPNGADDHFLQISSGDLGGQSKLVSFSDAHWRGDFTKIAGIR